MRRSLLILPALLFVGFALPLVKATADAPADKTVNRRITLYSAGKVVGVLNFYGTVNTKDKYALSADDITMSGTKAHSTLRLIGSVSINITQGQEKEIKLTADEAFIEFIPDHPLPIDF